MTECVPEVDHVSMRAAARNLGVWPRELEFAAQFGEIRTQGGVPPGTRRVPRAELERLQADKGFAEVLRERLRLVGTRRGAELLGISPSRFTRLARGGCFAPAQFYLNRYRAVVWLYLAAELRAFAERRPELLTGRAPRGLRVLWEEGVDYRPWHWRRRRVGQLSGQAADPWERAAARASVLEEGVLEECVPDARERARLLSLRPPLAGWWEQQPEAVREKARALSVATSDEEVLWYRLMLEADMEEARAASAHAAPPPAVPREGNADSPRLLTAVPRQPVPSRPAGSAARAATTRPAGRPRAPRWRDRLRSRQGTGGSTG